MSTNSVPPEHAHEFVHYKAEALFLNLPSLRKTPPIPSRLNNVCENIICHITTIKTNGHLLPVSMQMMFIQPLHC